MKKGNLLTLLFASVGMLVLIFDGKTAVAGIQNGIEICLRTLIPSLFPFFVISGLITSSVAGQPFPLLRPLGRICRIPEGSESLLAVGTLGGYPVGAKNISDAVSRKQLSKTDAQRMAVFCNCAGPSFLFGILGPLFPDTWWVWALWLIQILSAILTGILLPGRRGKSVNCQGQDPASLSEILNRSMKSMAAVCGWVTLFRMVLEFLDRWFLWLLPISAQVLLTGLLELSNGCISLSRIQSPALRFFLASVMLSLGGLCVLMQTKCVFRELDLKRYLWGKLIQSGICCILTAAVIPLLTQAASVVGSIGIITALAVAPILLFSRKRKKEVAIP